MDLQPSPQAGFSATVVDRAFLYRWHTEESQLISERGYLCVVEPPLKEEHAAAFRRLGAQIVMKVDDREASKIFLSHETVDRQLLAPGVVGTPRTVTRALIGIIKNLE